MNRAPRTDSERQKRRRALVKRLQKMPLSEGFQTLVQAGIYSPEGELRKEYGGEA